MRHYNLRFSGIASLIVCVMLCVTSTIAAPSYHRPADLHDEIYFPFDDFDHRDFYFEDYGYDEYYFEDYGYEEYEQEFFSAKEVAELMPDVKLPDSVDLLPLLTYSPEAREQGECGSCWIWAGTSAISITLAALTGIYEDLSVQYTISLLNNGGTTGDFACDGGDVYYLTEFYLDAGNKRVIPVTNKNAGYADADGGQSGGYQRSYKTNMPADKIVKTPYYAFADMYVREFDFTQPQDVIIHQMKSMLSQGHAIIFSHYMPSDSEWEELEWFWDNESEDTLFPLDGWDGIYYDERNGGSGHDVLIVGYDATDPNPKNHYWVLLNSWGAPDNRPNGTFRTPMYLNYQSKAPNNDFLNLGAAVIFTEFDVDSISPPVTPTPSSSATIPTTRPTTHPTTVPTTIPTTSSSAAFTDGHLPTLITSEDGVGYTWSEDGSILTIVNSGSYAFANTEFSAFGIYIDAPEVSLDGRKWDSEPTDEQVVITGNQWLLKDNEMILIGIHGDEDDMQTLRLMNVDIVVEGRDDDLYIAGVTVAEEIHNSSIHVSGTSGNFMDGIDVLYGSFSDSEITVLAGDESAAVGIMYLYGTIQSGNITITAQNRAQDFIIVGVYQVFETGIISGGSITLTSDGIGVASGVMLLMGEIKGGTFAVTSDEAYAVEDVEGGVISGGTFNLHGYSQAIGIIIMHDGALLSGGTFDVSGNNLVIGIGEVKDRSTVSEGTFDIYGKEVYDLLSVDDTATVVNDVFSM